MDLPLKPGTLCLLVDSAQHPVKPFAKSRIVVALRETNAARCVCCATAVWFCEAPWHPLGALLTLADTLKPIAPPDPVPESVEVTFVADIPKAVQ